MFLIIHLPILIINYFSPISPPFLPLSHPIPKPHHQSSHLMANRQKYKQQASKAPQKSFANMVPAQHALHSIRFCMKFEKNTTP